MHEGIHKKAKRSRRYIKAGLILLLIISLSIVGSIVLKKLSAPGTVQETIEYRITFDSSLTDSEQRTIREKIALENIPIEQDYTIRAEMIGKIAPTTAKVLDAYVPITTFGSVRQNISNAEIVSLGASVSVDISETITESLSERLGVTLEQKDLSTLKDEEIAFIPVGELDFSHKLLRYDGGYYLDEFNSGAEFRTVIFEGQGTTIFSNLSYSDLPGAEDTFKVNMTGVTALTRIMQRKLDTVGDPLYFSEYIGEFLADADLTHVSNEVSFKEGCTYSNTVFCSPPAFIETLKASGVDLVELTGNHNNDVGSAYNTETILLYESLGWDTVGGGLNTADAALPVIKKEKGSNVTFLAYNYPDSPNGGAISGLEKAGANSFDYTKIQNDIVAAKELGDYVIVNVQYWECYAYPSGFDEFPKCDKPIGEQESDFKKIIDLGADMVIGSSAHQPQTYELYNGKPIYYGLGNLYFDQTSWPGTERGIILTHYFIDGELVQTKLTPTVYDTDLQTRIMTDSEAEYLLQRLYDAR